MRELILLYLDKGRVRRMMRFQRIEAIPLLVAIVCTIVGIACAEQFGRVVIIVLTVLTGVCSLATTILHAVSDRYLYELCDEQLAFDRASGTEEMRAVSERYHAKLVVFRNSARHKLGVALTSANLLALFCGLIFSLLYDLGIFTGRAWVISILCVGAVVITGFVVQIASMGSAESECSAFRSEMRAEIAFYRRRAEATGVRISKTAEVRYPVYYFFDAEMRAEFRAAQKKNGVLGWVLASGLVIVGIFLDDVSPAAFIVLSVLGVAAIIFMAVYTAMYARRLRELYRLNEARLPQDAHGEVRRSLQKLYLTMQRRGNICFLSALILTVLIAICLTIAGYCLGEIALREIWTNFIGTAVIALVILGVVALVIWCIIYAIYRKQAAPLERQVAAWEEEGSSVDHGIQ